MPSPPDIRTYNLEDLIVHFGLIEIKGFGSNDFLRIAYDKPRFTTIEGLHGVEIPIMTKSHRGTASINIMRESGNNTQLSLISAVDQATGLGNFPFLVQYKNLEYVYQSTQSRISTDAPAIFGPKNGYMTWILTLYRLVRFG